MSTHFYEIVKRPLITEKVLQEGGEQGMSYAFEVQLKATKPVIKEIVENFFGVHVCSVKTLIMPSKLRRYGRTMGRKPKWKKAIVKLKPGESIELFETK